MNETAPSLLRIYTVAVSKGSVFTRLQGPGDPLKPANVQAQTLYSPSKDLQDRALYSPTSPTELERLPAGEHSFEVNGQPPGFHADLSLGLRSSHATVDLRAGLGGFLHAWVTLEQGAADLAIRPVELRPAHLPLRVLLNLKPIGALPYEYAEYDDNTDVGRRPLQKGENPIQARGQLNLFLALGECKSLELNWTWLSH